MIIECHKCDAKVEAKEIGSHFYSDIDLTVGLYLCPVCETVLVGRSDLIITGPGPNDYEWGPSTRLWPEPYDTLDDAIPEGVRRSIEDARKCLNSGVFSAAAVMCGRALEFVTIEKTGEKTLYKGLQKLKEQNVIDDRLFEWGEALRKERNIGAHAAEEEISRQDANDILDFAVAICDYIYVLAQKYSEYLDRKMNQ